MIFFYLFNRRVFKRTKCSKQFKTSKKVFSLISRELNRFNQIIFAEKILCRRLNEVIRVLISLIITKILKNLPTH
jgi:hypothetical protein